MNMPVLVALWLCLDEVGLFIHFFRCGSEAGVLVNKWKAVQQDAMK